MSVRVSRGRFIIDTVWPDGQRTRKAMPDRATADKINKKIEVAVADEDRIWQRLRRELRLEQREDVTFFGLCRMYFEQYVKSYNRGERCKKSHIDNLKRFIGDRKVDSLSPDTISRFVAYKLRGGTKPATVNRYLTTARHMMSWAVDHKVVESSPFGRVSNIKEVEWVGVRPDDALIDGIFDNIRSRDARMLPIFVFLRETGCRRGEAMGLKRSQLDFARQTVTFHGETKSGRSRQVPLTGQALWAVQSLPVLPHSPEIVFYHPDRFTPLSGTSIRWAWDNAARGTGLRVHDLRHAYAIRLAEEGCPMHFISEVLGHYSSDFTRRRYARFSPASASHAVLRVLEGRKAVANGTKQAQGFVWGWHGGTQVQ
jgi:integrase